MGLKRPFDAEEVQEFNVKHARAFTYSNELTQLDVVVPYQVSLGKPGIIGEDMSDICKSECEDEVAGSTWNENANHIDKCFETSSCEDTGSGATFQSSLSHESPESDFPWRPLSPVEDVYSCLLDRSPRKQVPIGPNYQADIPEFDMPVKEDILEHSGTALESRIDEDEERLIGKCIIPAPDTDVSGIEVCRTGKGRKDCFCWDKGSTRCVRQHIMEAREDLIETIGYEKFVKLGFCEMGEEVARKWTEEEEDLFHEVVYSNSVSMGRNFWKHLKAAFPSRIIKELVSYYFNVFILQRRAIQNRSESLDIDSDDDEWQVDYDTFYGAQAPGEEEDSSMESHFRRHAGVEYKKSLLREDNEDESNSSEDDDDDDDSDSDNLDGCRGDRGDYSGYLTKEAAVDDIRHVYMDKVLNKDGEEVNAEDDSCMSLEFQTGVVYPRSPTENKEKTETGKCWRHRFDGCGDLVNQLYSFDACDARLPNPWTKNVDLLPTSNMMEEIFGQDAWEDDNPRGSSK